MKQIINVLAVILLSASIGFSQTKPSSKPVKKVVTSKITKDPKTGKVVKTITTTTTTDVILEPGKQPSVAKTSTIPPKKSVIKANTQVATKKIVPKVTAKPVLATKKPVTAPKATSIQPATKAPDEVTVTEKKEEVESIYTNPTDKSASNSGQNAVVKPEVNKPYKATTNTTTVINSPTKKAPTKVFNEKKLKTARTSNLYWGIRGGANFATVESLTSMTIINSPTVNLKTGLNGGILFNIGIGKLFSIQPEINYSQQGFEITNGYDSETLNNQAINIPLLLKMAVGSQKVKFFVNGGPYYGYILGSEKTNIINGQTIRNTVNFSSEQNKEIQVRRSDYGVQAGAGFQINIGGPKLEIEGRYNYGLADPMIYTTSKPSYIGEIGRNRTITGTIGLLFPIGK
jgi:Outer membrane protein beta-barrel domain